MFQLFGFIDATKEINTKGIGLGLYISKRIVHQFGGEIGCKSKFGHGATFTFSFILEDESSVCKFNCNHRIKNPFRTKEYAKFKIMRDDKNKLKSTL